jgi:hypothetical protein
MADVIVHRWISALDAHFHPDTADHLGRGRIVHANPVEHARGRVTGHQPRD